MRYLTLLVAASLAVPSSAISAGETPSGYATPDTPPSISPEFKRSLETEYSTEMEERRKAWADLTAIAKESAGVMEKLFIALSEDQKKEDNHDYLALISQAYGLAGNANKYKRVTFYWKEALHQAEKYQLELVTQSDRDWLRSNAVIAEQLADAALRVTDIIIDSAETQRDGKPIGNQLEQLPDAWKSFKKFVMAIKR